jgi:flagellar L-ring protein FlgH
MTARAKWIGVLLCLAVLPACTERMARTEPPIAAGLPDRVPLEPRTAGAIYAAGHEVAFFEDTRAHRIGDLITVRLQETTSATKSATTSTKKGTTLANEGPTLFGQARTLNGKPIFESSLSGNSTFDGQGKSAQSNSLDGSITVTVVDLLPNGNLAIQGEKRLNLNQGDEFVRISGIVRALDVGADNTVTSAKVANAHISYSGRGFVQSANRMGWLARFFNSGLAPY